MFHDVMRTSYIIKFLIGTVATLTRSLSESSGYVFELSQDGYYGIILDTIILYSTELLALKLHNKTYSDKFPRDLWHRQSFG